MRSKHLVVELINHDTVNRLKNELDFNKAELNKLRKRYHDLEVKYGYEVHLNCELCDICKAHGYDFRPLLDSRNR